MIQRGLTNLTGKATLKDAWLSLISARDTVGLKVVSAPGPTSGTRPVVVEAVVKSLLVAGLPPRQIVVWDKHLSDLRQAGFFELAERFRNTTDSREAKRLGDELGRMVFGS